MILKLKARKWHKNGNSFYIENQNDIILHVKKMLLLVWLLVLLNIFDRRYIPCMIEAVYFLINNSFRSVAPSLKIFDRTTLDLQFRMCYKVAFTAHKTCL